MLKNLEVFVPSIPDPAELYAALARPITTACVERQNNLAGRYIADQMSGVNGVQFAYMGDRFYMSLGGGQK